MVRTCDGAQGSIMALPYRATALYHSASRRRGQDSDQRLVRTKHGQRKGQEIYVFNGRYPTSRYESE